MDWLVEAQELAAAGWPFALATVVRRVAPASAQTGAKALILSDGTMRGWVGGSCAQPVVVAEAHQALREGAPRLLRLGRFPGASEADGVVEYPMTCHSGGALEILIEPVLPMPRLVIVGETPVATTLVKLAGVMSYHVTAVADAPALTGALTPPDMPGFVIVASLGDDDETALAGALRAGVTYVALVASHRRAAVVRETLAAMDVSPEDIARLRAPAGLDIGARTQEEIALSIMAEITQLRVSAPPGAGAAGRGDRSGLWHDCCDPWHQTCNRARRPDVVLLLRRLQDSFRGRSGAVHGRLREVAGALFRCGANSGRA
jgi:xanthine dehydrogenase accessory factor